MVAVQRRSQTHLSTDRSQRAQGACADSPYCQPAATLLSALALRPRTGWCWLHLGPIGPRQTPLTTHGPAAQTVANVCKFGGGGGHACDSLPTWDEHRQHLGWRLDLFGVTERPPVQALHIPRAGLWVVAACAWRAPDGPWAEWRARLDAPCVWDYHVPGGPPSAHDLAALARGTDLIRSRRVQLGRPPLVGSSDWRALVEEAQRRYAARPGLGWDRIAESLNTSGRALRRWKALYRREAALSPAMQALIHRED